METVLRLPRRATYADYLAAEQNSDFQRRVKVYRRAGNTWKVATFGDGDSFELPTLSSVITVDEIHDRILDRSGQSVLRSR